MVSGAALSGRLFLPNSLLSQPRFPGTERSGVTCSDCRVSGAADSSASGASGTSAAASTAGSITASTAGSAAGSIAGSITASTAGSAAGSIAASTAGSAAGSSVASAAGPAVDSSLGGASAGRGAVPRAESPALRVLAERCGVRPRRVGESSECGGAVRIPSGPNSSSREGSSCGASKGVALNPRSETRVGSRFGAESRCSASSPSSARNMAARWLENSFVSPCRSALRAAERPSREVRCARLSDCSRLFIVKRTPY